jgi:uncharacterized protein with HEPN domain
MSDEVNKLLTDILNSIQLIEDYTKDVKLFEKYISDRKLKDSVERRIEIIGEAMSAILKIEPGIAITNSRKIVNTRNKLIHGYDEVEDVVVWEVVKRYLPVLKMEVEKLLKA